MFGLYSISEIYLWSEITAIILDNIQPKLVSIYYWKLNATNAMFWNSMKTCGQRLFTIWKYYSKKKEISSRYLNFNNDKLHKYIGKKNKTTQSIA